MTRLQSVVKDRNCVDASTSTRTVGNYNGWETQASKIEAKLVVIILEDSKMKKKRLNTFS